MTGLSARSIGRFEHHEIDEITEIAEIERKGIKMDSSNRASLAIAVVATLSLCWPSLAVAYPGGTPDFQTDVAPFCAACHSSLSESVLLGAPGDRAAKEVAERKHLAVILSGQKAYGELSEENRSKLVELIQLVDSKSTIALEYPPQVAVGETFRVTIRVAGGAGPTVGVGLVDRAHRWFAKPVSTLGWTIVGAPTIIGPDGQPQSRWLKRRPERVGRNVSFVNVEGWSSNADTDEWASAKIVFSLKAPDHAGDYPLVGFYLYGTEKATALGTQSHPVRGDQPRGGYGGKSGRVKFTPEHIITVK
jgi:hypothetical protein